MDPGVWVVVGLSNNRAAHRLPDLAVDARRARQADHPRAPQGRDGARVPGLRVDRRHPRPGHQGRRLLRQQRARRRGGRRRHPQQGPPADRRVWMQLGVVDAAAAERARAAGSTSSWTPAPRSSGRGCVPRGCSASPSPPVRTASRGWPVAVCARDGPGHPGRRSATLRSLGSLDRRRPARRSRSAAPLACASSRSAARNAVQRRPQPSGLLALPGPEDPRGQQPGVARPTHRHGGHGHARRHLHDREQRVHPVEVPQRHRHPDDRQRGDRREHPGQVGGSPGPGDEDAQPARLGRRGRTRPSPRASGAPRRRRPRTPPRARRAPRPPPP